MTTRRPPWMRTDEQQRLLAAARPFIRPYTAYTLALKAGLTCGQLAALDVCNVSPDGRAVRPSMRVPVTDGRRRDHSQDVTVNLAPPSKRVLEDYLTWRRAACPHVDRPMRTVRGPDRVQRCASCADVADFLVAPLFRSQMGGRLSPRMLRLEFARFRDAAGIRGWLHFDCLAQACARLRDGRGTE